MYKLLVFFLLISLLSCQSNSQPEPPQYNVPAEVEPFILAFRQEAQQRNKTVATNNLIVTFGTTLGEDVCGECIPGKTPRIVLNIDDFCWQKASQQERECLIFHELGHCLLNRAHKTDKFPNGAFISLMNPDNVTVYATCRYPIGDDECDKRPRRSYYIDELFDSSTPTPTWGK
ncbi:hypothetical protein IC229_00680 [Spirosoma sp. BT702]|uniref:Putative phage metallopeptidase domain-containing protein n=1 Tax=Spirosoma profusum TaxID=2771354 RepID=A0A927AM57_9BACT|nr:hypothetical protein [Spirosoma profusum]MBD2699134.1 hypothetical protein [Spirosoma profusum]